jgi:asparagine synthetase B (glutamine-hydrolysing)
MAGMFFIKGVNIEKQNLQSLIECIDPCSNCNNETVFEEDFSFAVSTLPLAPLPGPRYYEDSDYLCSFDGDSVDFVSIPWTDFIINFRRTEFEAFSSINGSFSILVFEKKTKRHALISDSRSQQPLYYYFQNGALIISSAIATFCRVLEKPEFNKKWLYEFLYYNFPVSDHSQLRDVFRMPPASVLQIDLRRLKTKLFPYAHHFKKADKLLKGKDALEKAINVFSERIPKYFEGNTTVACALTSGFDTRTLLSFCPSETLANLQAYTYGTAGCPDLMESAILSNHLGIKHSGIIFGNQFLKMLPKLIYETVYLSGGAQGINRSILPYVYEKLNDMDQDIFQVLSGTSGGQFFRGHGNVPAIISRDMCELFSPDLKSGNQDFFIKLLGSNYDDFKGHIEQTREDLEEMNGNFSSPESYLSYLVYQVAPKYFGGEANIANNFVTFRNPYWDNEIIKLAFEIEFSTLSFPRRFMEDDFDARKLQATLIYQNEKFRNSPIHGVPVSVFMTGNKILFHFYRLLNNGPKKLKNKLLNRSTPLIENWKLWCKKYVDKEIDSLLSETCFLTEYLDWEAIKKIKENRNIHWLAKIATAEIILALIKNGWDISPSVNEDDHAK